MSAVIYAIPIILAGVVAPVLALLSGMPVPGAVVLVIAPDARVRSRAIVAAGGREIGPVVAPLASLAISQNPVFVANLRARGVWLVVDGRATAAICGLSA